MSNPRIAALVFGLIPFLAGCDEDNTLSLRLQVRPDLSGTIVASSLALPSGPGAVEEQAVGAAFDRRAELQGATGRFAALTGLKIGDIQFAGGTPEGGLRWMRVELGMGANARWCDLFLPLSEADRRAAAQAFDPSGSAKDVGKVLKIEVELPSDVIGNGATGKVRGTKNNSDGATATLIVPIAAAREGTEPLVWHLTW